MDTIAGMKKLVPSALSSVIITALTKRAGNANRPRIVAIKMPHNDSGIRIKVMPLARACRIVVT